MRWLIAMSAIIAIVACAQQNSAGFLGGQVLTRPAHSIKSDFRVIYSFKGSPDGENPAGRLAVLDGKLYGTTRLGGNSQGTAFEVALDGTERVLHSFPASKDDGKQPRAGMTVVNGALYGTTEYGGGSGVYDLGTAFELQKDGSERVIYKYDGFNGGNPIAGLTADAGVLYGATFDHGRHYHGTLYALSTAGGFKLLHSFGRTGDGARPAAAPEFFRGQIYGTTLYGPEEGTTGGIVYEVNVTGKSYRKVHLFGKKADDGNNPNCRLEALGGTLYGTTERGGKFGKGTIFTIGANGTEAVLHSFDGSDGRDPKAGLTPYNGMLFGQTYDGGANNKGVVFEIAPAGSYHVLHEFDGKDGAGGLSELLLWNGKLYGTTSLGGTHNEGTVFEITP